jgi:hypothetical protein
MLYAICITLLVVLFLGITCQPEQVNTEPEPELVEVPIAKLVYVAPLVETPIVTFTFTQPTVQEPVQEVGLDLNSLGIRELKKLASAHHIKGYSNLRKAELIDRLLPLV